MGAVAAGELLHPLDRLRSTLADQISRAELLGQDDPVGVPAHDDDLLGSKPFRGDDPAQANRTVSDNGDNLA